ncbi:MAG: T9SS type A sorting domain-containing protein [Candidatus Cloacimonadales bacterium]|nr:T9SS type A sorting domain-containing protein [Candidatus Cloacimonadales bacterium]
MKKIFMIILLMFCVSVVFADCDMMAMIAKEGETISDIPVIMGGFNDPIDYFNFIRERSGSEYNSHVGTTKTNDDGYGFIYYEENNFIIPYNPDNIFDPTNQAWYLHGESGYYYHGTTLDFTPSYYLYNRPLNIAESMIMNNANYSIYPNYTTMQDNDDAEAVIVFGHARQGIHGTGNHPFRFEYNNRTYTLMHNGGLDDDFIDALETYLPTLENGYWFINHPSNWVNDPPPEPGELPGVLVDTELLFHYIMSFIISSGDVNIGIQQALTQTDIGGVNILDKIKAPDQVYDKELELDSYINVINFILSDGEALYVFRNSPDNDLWHDLSYKDNGDFYSVKTVSNETGTYISQNNLMKFTRDEDPVVLFDLDFEIKELKENGYNWISFPFLERDETSNATDDIVPYLDNMYPFGGITYIDMINISGTVLDWEEGDWNPEFYPVQSTQAFKIDIDSSNDEFILPMTGSRLTTDYVIEDNFYILTDYWLGYWLPETQNIVDAFGDLWSYVETIEAEDWYYDKCSNNRGVDPVPVSWSTTGKNLEYGKGYIVTFNDDFTDFYWTPPNPRTITQGYDVIETTYFTYNEMPSYEVIDVLNIPPNVIEIGVYQDTTCVGAVVVQDSCEQILVYSQTSNREEIPFSFEVIAGRSLLTSPVLSYNVYNENSGIFEPGTVIAGRQKSSIVMFGKIGEPEEENSVPTSDDVQLHGNYPNPFNPETNISFSIPTDQELSLNIYNMKGQKVRELISGQFASGSHSVVWDGKDENGRQVSSGLYFYKLKTDEKEISKKMLLLK